MSDSPTGQARSERTFEVDGGPLHAVVHGDPAPGRTVLAVHGITASSQAWASVAAALPPDWSLVAVDLRGRGRSRALPGPAGMRRHGEDLVRVAQQLGVDDPVLLGHSMGAYVSVLAVADHPGAFSRLVMGDGGVPLPLPEGPDGPADPDEVLAATLGPALERLRQTYPSVEAYVDFFRAHPALGPHWSDEVEAYVRYDALETPEGIRSRCVEDLIRTDGRDLLVLGDELDAALRGLALPAALLVAPGGMFGDPPGLLPADAVATYDDAVPGLEVETVPDVNHYTILFDSHAVDRVVAAVTRS